MDKKINKVTFHYDDGSYKYIEGEELDRWSGFNIQSATMLSIRGMNPDWSKVKWTEVDPNIEPQKEEDGPTEPIINAAS